MASKTVFREEGQDTLAVWKKWKMLKLEQQQNSVNPNPNSASEKNEAQKCKFEFARRYQF